MPEPIYTSAEALAHPTGAAAAIKDGRQFYTTSKLVNILWSNACARYLIESHSQITINAFDPGLMPGTGLGREYNGAVEKFMWYRLMPRILPLLRLVVSPNIHSPKESGEALAWVATSKDTKGITGKYFELKKEIPSSAVTYEVEKQNDIWNWTVEETTRGIENFFNFKV